MKTLPVDTVAIDVAHCDPSANTETMAEFFCRHLSKEYISHSELQGDRTKPNGEWVENLEVVVARELADALAQPVSNRLSTTWNGVVTACQGGRLVGMAILLYVREDHASFGVLEDLIVDATLRGRGVGTMLINFALADMKAAGLQRAYLESGINNHSAHALFHRVGFQPASVVMDLELGDARGHDVTSG